MARPFEVDPPLLDLPNPYPTPEALRAALLGGTRRDREIVVRLWLSEGLPCAFRGLPAIYEELRGWLSSQLCVHPKEVTIIGSARIGYSLAPLPEFGKQFGEHSDLDFSVISAPLFERLVSAFDAFAADYKGGSIVPRHDTERRMWDDNLEFAKRNIPQGFFDGNKVPTFNRYPVAQQINQAMWALCEKLKVTPGAPTVRRASTRVFRDWQCFIDRATLNLRIALPAA